MVYLVGVLAVFYALVVVVGAFNIKKTGDAIAVALLAVTSFALFSYLAVLLKG